MSSTRTQKALRVASRVPPSRCIITGGSATLQLITIAVLMVAVGVAEREEEEEVVEEEAAAEAAAVVVEEGVVEVEVGDLRVVFCVVTFFPVALY